MFFSLVSFWLHGGRATSRQDVVYAFRLDRRARFSASTCADPVLSTKGGYRVFG
jgi:hypothetical protein